MTNNLQ